MQDVMFMQVRPLAPPPNILLEIVNMHKGRGKRRTKKENKTEKERKKNE